MTKLPRYMTSGSEVDQFINDPRKNLFPPNLRKNWKYANPLFERIEGDLVLTIYGHEVMSAYQLPYMQRLADIVTRKGGNILNIGYGLGIVDHHIEEYRMSRDINEHVIVELNQKIADIAIEKHPSCKIVNQDWVEAIEQFPKNHFDGILYDGYPLNLEEVHRDGIIFLSKMMESGILKKGGVVTFYVDAATKISDEFISFIKEIGFTGYQFQNVQIKPPERYRQHWQHDHFIAPTLVY